MPSHQRIDLGRLLRAVRLNTRCSACDPRKAKRRPLVKSPPHPYTARPHPAAAPAPMNYAFPHITHLSEILDAIAGSQADEGGEFAVARRPWGTVVQYLFMYEIGRAHV